MIGTRSSIRSLLMLCIAVFAFMVIGTDASARNVPGSAAAATQDLSELASNDMADSILNALNSGNGPQISGVSRDASDNIVISSLGTGFEAEGGSFGGVHLNYRDLDVDNEYDGRLITGALSYGHRFANGVTAYAALLFEDTDVDTEYNSGTVENSGLGLAIGAKTDTQNGFTLSATLAALSLEYDVTRSDGAVTGSYDAHRWFLDLRAENTVPVGSNEIKYSFGYRRIEQTDDSYTESGGSRVDEQDYLSNVAFLNTKTYIGYDPAVRPFVQADVRYVDGNSDDLPGIDPDADGDDRNVRGYLGVGVGGVSQGFSYDAAIGGHFDDDGYTGLGAQLSVNFRF